MKETIVLYPTPLMGHIFSMVELGKLILNHYSHRFSIKILILTNEILDNPGITSYINYITQNHPSVSFLHFPPVSVDNTPNRSFAAVHFEFIRLNVPHVLQSLKEISKKGKISAFVIDIFCTSALGIAKDLNIPTYYFFTSGAACLAAFLHFPVIHEQHTESFKDLRDTTLHCPGIPPLKAIHMPEPMLDRNDPAYHDLIYFFSHLPRADGIIVNTFDDLEPKAVKTLATGICVPHSPTPPIYYIGPLITGGGDGVQHDCLSWLDQQPSKSVVFLCFGSRGVFSVEQVTEIANGLERSGQRFLWVLKNPPDSIGEQKVKTDISSDFDLDAVLPEGFAKRVEGKGMVVKSWAPQVTVLNHDSIGGFVTHCGWNSVLEAVVAGVPMVAWPLYAEQHLNRNILVEDMEMAIPVQQREEDGFVSGTELERLVRELMDSDKGKEMKERSWRMKERAVDSWGESGSSIGALAKLIKAWEQVGNFEEQT